MHHLILGSLFYALLASLVVALGCAAIAPMVNRMAPQRLRATVAFWAVLCLAAPAVWCALNTYLGAVGDTYLHELGHEWEVYTMFLSGLLFSLARQRRDRAR